MDSPVPTIAPSPDALELWRALAARANAQLSDEQAAQLSRYIDLLFAGNARMNLTRIPDRAAAEVQHVGDALTLLPHLPPGAHELVDVGSGGGVPGIPLAIARPDARVLLVESTKKKAAFLHNTIVALGLKNARVSELRAEEIGQAQETRERFDVAVARAVATTDWLAEWLLPLVRKGGKALAMKGQKAAEEVPQAAKAIEYLNGGPPVVHAVELPGSAHRVIVEIPKLGKTAQRYPRPPTLAKGKPLGAAIR